MEKKRSYIFPWVICGLGALFYCYEYILRISPSVMTQQLAHSFNINAALLGNMVAFYYYAYTPMQLPVGVLMDRYGPRRLLVIAALICALGSYLFAHGHLGTAEVGRFMVGLGSAFAFVGVLKLATLWLPPSRFAMIAGMVTSLGMLGAMFGDVWLGRFVQSVGWQTTVNVCAVLGIFIAALIWFTIPNQRQAVHAEHTAVPMTYRQLLAEFSVLIRKPIIWIVGLVGCLLYLPTSAFAELWGIPYLEHFYKLSSATAADTISMIFLGWAVGGPIVGWISDRFSKRTLPIIIGALLATFITCLILYLPAFSNNKLYFLFFLIGVFTSVENITFAIARENNHPSLVGTAMAVNNMLIMLGGVVFQPLIGVFLEMVSGNNVKGNLSVYSGQDFQHALIILPIALMLAAALIAFVKEKHFKQPQSVSQNNPPQKYQGVAAVVAD